MRSGLADLDELVLQCRDDFARECISEAVACYRAGAFRACVVSTWAAVVYDFAAKLRELAMAGDNNAERRAAEFDEACETADMQASLEFERTALDVAKDEFELLSHLEHDDLGRLLQDRHRCAHPSMNSRDERYQPTAELARCHLRNAVSHMLQHPPKQGKAALDRLRGEVASEYFPSEVDAAVAYFSHGPLAHPRQSLVRNFALVLVKAILLGDEPEQQYLRYCTAIQALLAMHRDDVERALEGPISEIARRVADADLSRVVRFLREIHDLGRFLEEDQCERVREFVAQVTKEQSPGVLPYALDIESLRDTALERLSMSGAPEVRALIRVAKRQEFADRALALYADAGSFDGANYMAVQLLMPLADVLRREHVEGIMHAAARNTQIRYSRRLDDLLRAALQAGAIAPNDFVALCQQEADLADFADLAGAAAPPIQAQEE